MKISIDELMQKSGVKFGTSGARGLVAKMSDFVCYSYTKAFIKYLESIGDLKVSGEKLAVAGDLRPSTGRIMEAVERAIIDSGYEVVKAGLIPTPAVALFGLTHGWPSIMVTGSHIPADRNGIKFNKKSGEILKDDEKKIREISVEIGDGMFDGEGNFTEKQDVFGEVVKKAEDDFLTRYLHFFPPKALADLHIGLFEHSAVGRDILSCALDKLGAQVEIIGRAEQFTAVDNEALDPKVMAQVKVWSKEGKFDAIVSTDGDSDRPIIWDEKGDWVENDLADIICAKYLGAETICTTLSGNTAVEKSGWFPSVIRTKIGSPYVVEAMIQSEAKGLKKILGYENNGGMLLQSSFEIEGKTLAPLPTRDAFIVILSVLCLAKKEGKRISDLFLELPQTFMISDHIVDFAREKADLIIKSLDSDEKINTFLGPISGPLQSVDNFDGLRLTFKNGEIIHLRPSGNAPEMRVYSEAGSRERAQVINGLTMKMIVDKAGGSSM